MTTKVVKGSIWTLMGQVAPLAVSLFTTPFVIRMLGAESYGVLILVALIPTYLGFGDLGMGIASTKFASEAYADGDPEREARVVRTAALIALCTSLVLALALFAFSPQIISLFNVPENLRGEASLALKLAAITFVLAFLGNIFNTPQLTRLRMDLNTMVGAGPRILGLIATPIVLYLGGGVVGAVAVLMGASVLTLLGHLFISGKLNSYLFALTIEPSVVGSMLRFGGALAIGGVASVALMNLEKAALARIASVQTLAYYSVAFMLASTANMFSVAMVSSLVPAFSQLLNPDKQAHLRSLFSRALRLNLIVIIPMLSVLFVAARPFFATWAGQDFGRESTLPFYVLTVGLFFNLSVYVPYSLLMAVGRTDVVAKIYWIELFPYLGIVAFLTSRYGAVGTAAAWSIRVAIDSILIIRFSGRAAALSYRSINGLTGILGAAIILAPPAVVTLFIGDQIAVSVAILVVCLLAYGLVVWTRLVTTEEKAWALSTAYRLIGRYSAIQG